MKFCFMLRRIISFAIFTCAGITFALAENAYAGNSGKTGENFMESQGMIYVVVGVVAIILCGLIFYLFTLDRKISRLEKEWENKD